MRLGTYVGTFYINVFFDTLIEHVKVKYKVSLNLFLKSDRMVVGRVTFCYCLKVQ